LCWKNEKNFTKKFAGLKNSCTFAAEYLLCFCIDINKNGYGKKRYETAHFGDRLSAFSKEKL
jgi:hypothetical protein